jgi:magnesium transporter
MPYISEILGKPVVDVDGKRVGKINEIIAVHQEKMVHPQITAIEVKRGRRTLYIPFQDIHVMATQIIPLCKKWDEIKPYKAHRHDIFLVRDILDKQIIDTNGVRVVRVNDVELVRVNGNIYLANVDISSAGLMRRLGLPIFKRKKNKPSKKKNGAEWGSISWDAVELLGSDQPMRLKVPGDKISDLHPADLAELLGDLSRQEGTRLLQKLDTETMADTLEEVEPDFQASLIEEMPDERVADVLEEMSPDEAADLLAELPKKRSNQIIKLMEPEEAEDVKRLLAYPENSAGGIMSTDFVSVPSHFSAEEVISRLRRTREEVEIIFDIYVTDRHGKAIGYFSLRDLVLANPTTPVKQFMEGRLVTVEVSTSQQEVAQVIAKYNLLAVPVVDNEQKILGIVTADDALDKVIPTAWKKRLPKFYH